VLRDTDIFYDGALLTILHRLHCNNKLLHHLAQSSKNRDAGPAGGKSILRWIELMACPSIATRAFQNMLLSICWRLSVVSELLIKSALIMRWRREETWYLWNAAQMKWSKMAKARCLSEMVHLKQAV